VIRGTHPNGLPWFDDGSGERRVLACLPPRPDFGNLPKFRSQFVPLPRTEWLPLDRRARMPWILDQDSISSCVGNGAAGALRRARLLAGASDVALSPGFLYALINGGSDNGAVISDACDALTRVGTCTYTTVGERPFYTQQMPAAAHAEAARFRVARAYHAQTFDEIVSGLLLGFLPVFGIMVGNSFQRFDRHGVAGHTPGPGNHCLHADGCARLDDGRWVLDTVNSWGDSWGPWKNGRCYLDEDHFAHGDQPDAFLIEAVVDDPEDPNNPPAPLP
jgi:hypothetical protein